MMDPEDMHTALLELQARVEELEAREGRTIDSMSLAQLEALAARLGAAAKTIRDAQALLSGRPGQLAPAELPEQQAAVDPIALHRARQLQAPEQGSLGGAPRVRFSPAEQADRARALAQFTPDPSLPDEIAELERT